MANSEKNRQIVILTVFATILVVIGHSDITNDYKKLWIYKWIYSFHMPLFFFISGFLFCFTLPVEKLKKTSFLSFVKKKSIRLLIPFLFINTIIFIIKSKFISDQSILQHPVNLDFNSFLMSTFFSPMGFMWFLPALFTVFVSVFKIYKVLRTRSINGCRGGLFGFILTIGLLIVATLYLPHINFMQISQAIYFATFFLLGILYCDYKSKIDHVLKKYWLIIGGSFLIASVSLYFTSYIAAFCGIGFSLAFSLLLESKCSDRLVDLSAFSYTVFLLSYFPQMFIRGPIQHMVPHINQYILSCVSFLSGLIVPVWIGMIALKIKNKHTQITHIFKLIGL